MIAGDDKKIKRPGFSLNRGAFIYIVPLQYELYSQFGSKIMFSRKSSLTDCNILSRFLDGYFWQPLSSRLYKCNKSLLATTDVDIVANADEVFIVLYSKSRNYLRWHLSRTVVTGSVSGTMIKFPGLGDFSMSVFQSENKNTSFGKKNS